MEESWREKKDISGVSSAELGSGGRAFIRLVLLPQLDPDEYGPDPPPVSSSYAYFACIDKIKNSSEKKKKKKRTINRKKRTITDNASKKKIQQQPINDLNQRKRPILEQVEEEKDNRVVNNSETPEKKKLKITIKGPTPPKTPDLISKRHHEPPLIGKHVFSAADRCCLPSSSTLCSPLLQSPIFEPLPLPPRWSSLQQPIAI